MTKNTRSEILNKEQLAAVTMLDGPLLIVAGAGSGKTRVITHRIAYILEQKKDIGPENILALTFSRKAAAEMRNRVSELIDEDPEDITISTFHSFCHSILNEHGIEIGLKNNFRLLNNTEQRIFFKNLIPNLKLDYYSDITDFVDFTTAVLKFISRCKDELVNEEEYAAFIRKLADGEERRRSEEILAAYQLYHKKCKETGHLDFGDLIIKTIELFKKRQGILTQYQERYRYILVDEFQDTNVAQIELITMLANRYKNICAVGDDDQAIYRFRGASYASFTKFKEYFPDLRNLKLTQNYRSTKKVLRIAENLIRQNNIDRYDPQKSLWTQNDEGKKIEVIMAPNYAEEARCVVKRIKEIYKKERCYSKIVILYRAHSHKEELLKLLKIENIPHSIWGGVGMSESDEVKEAMAYLKALTDTEDSASIFKLASSAEHDIDYADLIRINAFSKYSNLTLYKGFLRIKDVEVSEETKRKIKDFLDFLKGLKRTSDRYSLLEFIYQLISVKTTILKRAFVKQSVYGEPALRNIGKFYNLISQYAQAARRKDLHALMEYLDAYIEAGGKMESEEDIRSDYGVQLMTVHQAKGLEFPYVFVISLVQNRFPTSFKKEAVPFPEELIKEPLPQGNFHIEEERRLLYVALTRTQKRLFLSGIQKSYSRPSIFLDEIISPEEKNSDIDYAKLESGDSQERIESTIEIPISNSDTIKMGAAGRVAKLIGDVKIDELKDKDYIAKIEKGIKAEFNRMVNMLNADKEKEIRLGKSNAAYIPTEFWAENIYSFTQIESYMGCPLRYKFLFVDNIPRRPKPYFTLGSVIHDVLKELYTYVQKDYKVDIKKLLDIYNELWLPIGYRNKREEKLYKTRGEKELIEFFKKNKDELKAPLFIEKKFTIELGGKPFKGFIDRVDELEDGSVEIIDYKTGKSKKESTTQLDLYAIAAIEKLGLDVSRLSFYYISSNTKKTFRRTPDDLEQTKAKVIDIISKIESGDFQPKVSYQCKFCDYQILCPAYNK